MTDPPAATEEAKQGARSVLRRVREAEEAVWDVQDDPDADRDTCLRTAAEALGAAHRLLAEAEAVHARGEVSGNFACGRGCGIDRGYISYNPECPVHGA